MLQQLLLSAVESCYQSLLLSLYHQSLSTRDLRPLVPANPALRSPLLHDPNRPLLSHRHLCIHVPVDEEADGCANQGHRATRGLGANYLFGL